MRTTERRVGEGERESIFFSSLNDVFLSFFFFLFFLFSSSSFSSSFLTRVERKKEEVIKQKVCSTDNWASGDGVAKKRPHKESTNVESSQSSNLTN